MDAAELFELGFASSDTRRVGRDRARTWGLVRVPFSMSIRKPGSDRSSFLKSQLEDRHAMRRLEGTRVGKPLDEPRRGPLRENRIECRATMGTCATEVVDGMAGETAE